jgi:hypothetical protein
VVRRERPGGFQFWWLLEPMLVEAGFQIVEADFDRSVYGRYTCIRRNASKPAPSSTRLNATRGTPPSSVW